MLQQSMLQPTVDLPQGFIFTGVANLDVAAEPQVGSAVRAAGQTAFMSQGRGAWLRSVHLAHDLSASALSRVLQGLGQGRIRHECRPLHRTWRFIDCARMHFSVVTRSAKAP